MKNIKSVHSLRFEYNKVKADIKDLDRKYILCFKNYLEKYKALVDKLEKINKQLDDLKAEIETK